MKGNEPSLKMKLLVRHEKGTMELIKMAEKVRATFIAELEAIRDMKCLVEGYERRYSETNLPDNTEKR